MFGIDDALLAWLVPTIIEAGSSIVQGNVAHDEQRKADRVNDKNKRNANLMAMINQPYKPREYTPSTQGTEWLQLLPLVKQGFNMFNAPTMPTAPLKPTMGYSNSWQDNLFNGNKNGWQNKLRI